jgi:hypothetical protein
MQLGVNLGKKGSIVKNKSSRTKSYFFLKKFIVESTMIYERMNSKIAIVKPLSLLYYTIIST